MADNFWRAIIAGTIFTGAFMIAAPVNQRLGEISNKLGELKPGIEYKLQERNVIGRDEPETFYEIGGQRVYLTVDGKPVEDLVSKVKYGVND